MGAFTLAQLKLGRTLVRARLLEGKNKDIELNRFSRPAELNQRTWAARGSTCPLRQQRLMCRLQRGAVVGCNLPPTRMIRKRVDAHSKQSP